MKLGEMIGSSSNVVRKAIEAVTGAIGGGASGRRKKTAESEDPCVRCRSGTCAAMGGGSGVRLGGELAAWLEGMAAAHNYGSVNKTLRDLIEWYGQVDREEVGMVFGRESTGSTGAGGEGEGLTARLTKEHVEWLKNCSEEFGMRDRNEVLARLLEFAMEELDGELIFEHSWNLPTSTHHLYTDLNIYSDLLHGSGECHRGIG